jgi:hypothetical protein
MLNVHDMISCMKNFSVKKIAIVIILTFFSSLAPATLTSKSDLPLCEKVSLEARSGDLIFIAIDSFIFRQIADTTKTWTSHVGIIFYEKGEWVVYESRVPKSTVTPLCDFISRSVGDQVNLRRYQLPHNRSMIKFLKSEAKDRLGLYYNTGFDYDNEGRMFCSKYVYDVFMQAGIEVGKLETLEEVFEQNPEADVNFWNRWYLGRIPWQRRTVTPASQLRDPKFITVFSNNTEKENSQIQPVNALGRVR